MLDFFWNIIAFFITLGTLITIHEFGHFIMARYYGVKVERFSIGFGKILWKWYDKNNTEYVISVIPLGGYVKMFDERPDKKRHDNYCFDSFHDKTIWQRGVIIFAGPFFNFIFSIILYWIIFMIGMVGYRPIIGGVINGSIADQAGIISGTEIVCIDDVFTPDWDSVRLQLINKFGNKEILIGLSSDGSSNINKYAINLGLWKFDLYAQDPIFNLGIVPVTPQVTSILTKIYSNSVAMKAGLKAGDKIIMINNRYVDSWDVVTSEVKNNPEKMLSISVDRQGKILNFNFISDKKILDNGMIEGFIGVLPHIIPLSKEYKIIQRMNCLISLYSAIKKTYQITVITINMLKKIIIGDISLNSLSGPISIAQGAGASAEHGYLYYLIFLATISINLGIINLLPLPILDGGYLLFLIIEKIRGKPFSEKLQHFSYRVGFIILLLLMCLAIINDLSRL